MSSDKLNFKGRLEDKKSNSELLVSLNIVSFKDGNTEILYAPAMEVYGYGNDIDEAKISFEICFREFINYTHNKNTFEEELARLGWKIKGSKSRKRFTTPELSELIKTNARLTEILNTKDFTSYKKELAIA
jgi:hypothetical protein